MIYTSFLLSDYSIVWASQMVGTSRVIAFSLHPIWFCRMMLLQSMEKLWWTFPTWKHGEKLIHDLPVRWDIQVLLLMHSPERAPCLNLPRASQNQPTNKIDLSFYLSFQLGFFFFKMSNNVQQKTWSYTKQNHFSAICLHVSGSLLMENV